MISISRFKNYCKPICGIIQRQFSGEPKFIHASGIFINDKVYKTDDFTNVTERILSKVGKSLHGDVNHPLGIIAARIKDFFYQNFRKGTGSPVFSIFDNLSPVVTVEQNFDSLLFPADHISRSTSDTYYINQQTLLRSHTSAHEADLIMAGLDAFIIIGDVYRRDEIDQTHYPAFHQVEGVRLFTQAQIDQIGSQSITDTLLTELKSVLERLARSLLGDGLRYRWVETTFPWTSPSLELEVEIEEDIWLEVLGCGVLREVMLRRCGAGGRVGIAFGLGLERLAMRLFSIDDIRLFWSRDEGFLAQFRGGDVRRPITYKPISAYPPCLLDLSLWLPRDRPPFHKHDLLEVVRAVAGDLVERVDLIDDYQEGGGGRRGQCYRVAYRHMRRTLTRREAVEVHQKIGDALVASLGCTVR